MREQRTYRNFDLLVEPNGPPGRYLARVVASPYGEATEEFELTFSKSEAEEFTDALGSGVDSRVQDFGAKLFGAVFRGSVGIALAVSLERTVPNRIGLRIRLRLTAVPELADLPWEYLYVPSSGRYLALSEWTPVARYLEFLESTDPLAVIAPLKVLVVASAPVDREELAVEEEKAKLREALSDLVEANLVQIDDDCAGTIDALREKLRGDDYHVLHFIGHGGVDEKDDGMLLFEDAERRAVSISARMLGELLHDQQTLRVTVLNSCEGARASRRNPFAGTAQTLLRQGIRAVVAMQFAISDAAAIAFAHSLYEAVADAYPLDAAIAESRKTIKHQSELAPGGAWIEWGTPVLHLHVSDARIFAVDAEGERPAGDGDDATPPSGTRELDYRHFSMGTAFFRNEGVHSVAFTPDGARLVVCTPDANIVVDVSSGRSIDAREWPAPWRLIWRRWLGRAVADVAVHPSGPLVARGSDDKTVRLWDVRTTGERVLAHPASVTAVAFSPTGDRLASACRDGRVRVWDPTSGERLLAIQAGSSVAGVAFSPDGQRLAGSCADGTLRIWKSRLGEEEISVARAGSGRVVFSPDGSLVATAWPSAQVWDARTGDLFRSLPGTGDRNDPIGAMATDVDFHPGGDLVAVACDHRIRLWDLRSGEEVPFGMLGLKGVRTVAFSPDGSLLAFGSVGSNSLGIGRLSDVVDVERAAIRPDPPG